jgi:iron complex outermembrane receptor protein
MIDHPKRRFAAMKSLYAILWIVVALLMASVSLSYALTLSGAVVDQQNVPLSNVNVTIPALHRGTVTSQDGRFAFPNLPAGVYTVRVTAVGYAAETRTVNLSAGDVTLNVALRVSPIETSGLTVTAKPQPTDALTSPQSVSVVEGRQLDRQRGESLMRAIENSPGVSLYTTGAGIVKPVIRGFTSQRVLVVMDGIRQEGQQWGDEHGPEIDGLDVDRIEVVRGPNSVLYGSDALGGVVNIVKADVPTASGDSAEFGGNLLFDGFSNNRQRAGALSLRGAGRAVGFRANLSGQKATNVTTPTRRLYNSGTEELNGSGMLGVKGDWGALSVDYAHVGQKLQIHEDPAEEPGATPYQKVGHDRAHLHADLHFPELRLEADGSWQRNNRKEFEEKDAPGPVLNLVLDTASLDVKGHHQPVGAMFGTVGISVMGQRNRTLAEEQLIPEFDLLNFAGFLYEEVQLKEVSLSAGVRYDARSVDVKANPDLNVAAQTRDYSAVTGTAGLVYRAGAPLAFAFNVGRGWRAPTAFELFADGVHEGTVRYEVGDADMRPEVSLNVDLAVRYASHRAQGELSVFQNKINRYIYLSPTGQQDPDSGFEIFLNRQADATLVGAEFSLQAQAADWLVLNAGADFVRGTNDLTDRPLPLIPAHRLKLGARLTKASVGGLKNPYLSVDAKVVAAQGRVDVFETPTGGYRLLDVGLGAEIPVGQRRASIDLAVENLFNRAYVDHLSRYKGYALNPGRNFTVKVSLPFGAAR